MPTRIIREGIISSQRINALSFGAEVFYRRLMTVADDYGRFYASPVTLRGACWPTFPEKVTESQVRGWLIECSSGDNPLISIYESNGCKYLEIQNFGQQTRSKSKFPTPVFNSLTVDNQPLSNGESNVQPSRSRSSESETKSNSDTESNKPVSATNVAVIKPAKPDPVKDWFNGQFWNQWVKRKDDDKEAALNQARKIAKTSETRELIVLAAKAQRESRLSQDPEYRKGANNWLKDGGWKNGQPEQPEILPFGAQSQNQDKNQTRRMEALAMSTQIRGMNIR